MSIGVEAQGEGQEGTQQGAQAGHSASSYFQNSDLINFYVSVLKLHDRRVQQYAAVLDNTANVTIMETAV